MKKTITILFFTLISIKQFAQIEKGTYVPSISINWTYVDKPSKDTASSLKNDKYSVFTNIGFGRFVKDNLLLTGKFSYGHSDYKTDYINNTNIYKNQINSGFGNTESISLSLAKYKFVKENFSLVYGATFSISYSELITKYYSYYEKNGFYIPQNQMLYSNTLSAQVNLFAGIQYFISKNLALTGEMGFFSISDSYSPYLKSKQTDTHTLSFNLTPSFNAFNVGITYYVRQKATPAR